MNKISRPNKKTVILFYGLFSPNQSYDWIPYGPLFVYAKLKEAGFNPVLIHEFKDRDYEDVIKKYAAETLLFGVSAMTGYQIKSAIAAIKCFRKYNDQRVPVIWGGAHATAMPLETLKSGYADYVCAGNAKNNFIDFVKALSRGEEKTENFFDILNLENFSERNKRYEVKDYNYDLSDFPPFYFTDFDFLYLITKNKVLNYTASVGCPGVCTFCSWGGRHPWSALPLPRVLNDIEYLVNKYGLKSIWFSDSDLSLKKDYLLGLAQGLIDRKLNIYWRCNARAAELLQYTSEDFILLEKSGLDRLFLGVENVNSEIQKLYRKIIKPEMVFEILKKMKTVGIQIMISFIFGNPRGFGDLDENRKFLDDCQKINSRVRFQTCFYAPYPGTLMTDLAQSDGYAAPLNLEEYGASPYFLNTDRSLKDKIAWFNHKDSTSYIKRFKELFPKVDSLPEWNWRDQINN
jgi:radical SAM superfamily enzyme YgiQ (UPF0313 family)